MTRIVGLGLIPFHVFAGLLVELYTLGEESNLVWVFTGLDYETPDCEYDNFLMIEPASPLEFLLNVGDPDS